ncbi:MAG: addiction module antitoxin RelB [Nitrospinae bacterium RIFCSPLOWO2_12_39_16]|nr:MAG: addiction module antitoxin RelB [Nitrospinae bacterium RIFCSPLOWO2_02_39_17]OGW10738.1 MAG: addiction module antitoxin RelB [Nitrospinae bacterium RIFCSPLOWO2_12_39_16]HLA48535.1 addiction module protein [Nitrospinota bacterium]
MSFEELKAEALKMSPKSRAELAKELLVSLDTLSDAEVEQLWIEKAIRRDDEIDQGVAQMRPAEEVFKGARDRFR